GARPPHRLEHLRLGGALLTVLTDLFTHPNVHYLSGFYGPLERILRDSGANIGFAPADFRRFEPILAADPPRVMTTAAAPPEADRAIAERVRTSVTDGATLQTGIGAVPSMVASLLAEGDGGDYGIHSEMFTNGLMTLCRSGKVTNLHKGTYDGVSVTTFAAGT